MSSTSLSNNVISLEVDRKGSRVKPKMGPMRPRGLTEVRGRMSSLAHTIEDETEKVEQLATLSKRMLLVALATVIVACATTGIIVSTRETSVTADGDLADKGGNALFVNTKEESSDIRSVHKAPFEDLHNIENLIFAADHPTLEDFLVSFRVSKFVRGDNITFIYSTSESTFVTLSDHAATYTDAEGCKSGCPIITSPESGRGRRLVFGSFWGWVTGKPKQKPKGICAKPIFESYGDCTSQGRQYTQKIPRLEFTGCSCGWRWWNCGVSAFLLFALFSILTHNSFSFSIAERQIKDCCKVSKSE